MSKNEHPHNCSMCGTAMTLQWNENRRREVCPACGWIRYEQLKIGAGAIIERNGQLLLLRRAHDPWQGTWNIPSGYVEADEDPARAAEREALEESGLQVRVTRLVDALFFDDDPRGNGLHLIYACDIVGGDLRNSHESTALRFFAPAEIPADLCGAGHARAIRSWQAARRSLTTDHRPPTEF